MMAGPLAGRPSFSSAVARTPSPGPPRLRSPLSPKGARGIVKEEMG